MSLRSQSLSEKPWCAWTGYRPGGDTRTRRRQQQPTTESLPGPAATRQRREREPAGDVLTAEDLAYHDFNCPWESGETWRRARATKPSDRLMRQTAAVKAHQLRVQQQRAIRSAARGGAQPPRQTRRGRADILTRRQQQEQVQEEEEDRKDREELQRWLAQEDAARQAAANVVQAFSAAASKSDDDPQYRTRANLMMKAEKARLAARLAAAERTMSGVAPDCDDADNEVVAVTLSQASGLPSAQERGALL